MSNCQCSGHSGFLTAKGLKEAAQRELELAALDVTGRRCLLDRVGSVSAMPEPEHVFVDVLIDEQHRRFLNGS